MDLLKPVVHGSRGAGEACDQVEDDAHDREAEDDEEPEHFHRGVFPAAVDEQGDQQGNGRAQECIQGGVDGDSGDIDVKPQKLRDDDDGAQQQTESTIFDVGLSFKRLFTGHGMLSFRSDRRHYRLCGMDLQCHGGGAAT